MRRRRVSRYSMPTASLMTGGLTTLMWVPRSSIAPPLLPGAPLQSEVADEDGREQERHHRDRDRRALAQGATRDRALERQGGHQVRRVERPAARDDVDQLEVGEGE